MSRRGYGSLALALVAGAILALLCMGAGLLVVGMGHGWEAPLEYGFFSLFFYPLAFMRLWVDPGSPWRRDLSLTALVATPALLLLIVAGRPAVVAGEMFGGLFALAVGVPLFWFAARALGRSGRQAAVVDGALLALGVPLDIAALADGLASPRAHQAGAFVAVWAVLWLGWQVVAAVALVRHLRAPRA